MTISSPRPDGINHSASLLDGLLVLTDDAGRRSDLHDDLNWMRAAAGRDARSDPRLPLIH
jgi:hypothetical protein